MGSGYGVGSRSCARVRLGSDPSRGLSKRVHCLRLHAFSLADSCGISGVFVQGVAAPALLAEVGAGFSWKGSFL
jgi:hypothetical protein